MPHSVSESQRVRPVAENCNGLGVVFGGGGVLLQVALDLR